MPAINLTDDELVAVAAAIRRAIETDRFQSAAILRQLSRLQGSNGQKRRSC
jgi:hypothetical protein